MFKITKKDKIDAFAKRKSDTALKIIIVIVSILFLGNLFTNEGKASITLLIIIFLFIGSLFYVLFLSVKKMMWFLGKNLNYQITDKILLIEQNLDNETEMNFIVNYMYRSGRRKGGYRNVSIEFDKMKSINKNSKGDLILTTNKLLMKKVIIPREIENLRDLENQLRNKIKRISVN